MIRYVAILTVLAAAAPVTALAQTPMPKGQKTTAVTAPPVAAGKLSAADEAAVFKAAGFKRQGKAWRSPCGLEDPASLSYSPGVIDSVRDLNGDGRPEAIVTESGTFCYGMTGTGYSIVSKQATGGWSLMTAGTGIPDFLATKGVGGWPDIEVGGPGFCFPVERWNGKQYVLNRHQYEGKRCRPN